MNDDDTLLLLVRLLDECRDTIARLMEEYEKARQQLILAKSPASSSRAAHRISDVLVIKPRLESLQMSLEVIIADELGQDWEDRI